MKIIIFLYLIGFCFYFINCSYNFDFTKKKYIHYEFTNKQIKDIGTHKNELIPLKYYGPLLTEKSNYGHDFFSLSTEYGSYLQSESFHFLKTELLDANGIKVELNLKLSKSFISNGEFCLFCLKFKNVPDNILPVYIYKYFDLAITYIGNNIRVFIRKAYKDSKYEIKTIPFNENLINTFLHLEFIYNQTNQIIILNDNILFDQKENLGFDISNWNDNHNIYIGTTKRNNKQFLYHHFYNLSLDVIKFSKQLNKKIPISFTPKIDNKFNECGIKEDKNNLGCFKYDENFKCNIQTNGPFISYNDYLESNHTIIISSNLKEKKSNSLNIEFKCLNHFGFEYYNNNNNIFTSIKTKDLYSCLNNNTNIPILLLKTKSQTYHCNLNLIDNYENLNNNYYLISETTLSNIHTKTILQQKDLENEFYIFETCHPYYNNFKNDFKILNLTIISGIEMELTEINSFQKNDNICYLWKINTLNNDHFKHFEILRTRFKLMFIINNMNHFIEIHLKDKYIYKKEFLKNNKISLKNQNQNQFQVCVFNDKNIISSKIFTNHKTFIKIIYADKNNNNNNCDYHYCPSNDFIKIDKIKLITKNEQFTLLDMTKKLILSPLWNIDIHTTNCPSQFIFSIQPELQIFNNILGQNITILPIQEYNINNNNNLLNKHEIKNYDSKPLLSYSNNFQYYCEYGTYWNSITNRCITSLEWYGSYLYTNIFIFIVVFIITISFIYCLCYKSVFYIHHSSKKNIYDQHVANTKRNDEYTNLDYYNELHDIYH
jgi:hypothetical protein